jgi:hypothetical protein
LVIGRGGWFGEAGGGEVGLEEFEVEPVRSVGVEGDGVTVNEEVVAGEFAEVGQDGAEGGAGFGVGHIAPEEGGQGLAVVGSVGDGEVAEEGLGFGGDETGEGVAIFDDLKFAEEGELEFLH